MMHRSTAVRLALAAAALVGLIAAAIVIFRSDRGGGSTDVPFGFVDNSFEQSGVPPAEGAELARASGATAQRFAVSWATVQCCSASRFDWSTYDEVVGSLRASGLAPLPVLVGSPRWARSRDCLSALCPPAPRHRRDFARFAAEAARRWDDSSAEVGLLGIQLWNEPNSVGSWPTKHGPDPREYGRLFRAVAGRIDGDLPLVVAGLDGRAAVSEPPRYLSVPDFLTGFLRALGPGGLESRDLLAAHAYAPRFTEIMRETRAVRDQLAPGRSIMVTETGASSELPTVDEQRQATDVRRVLAALDNSDDIAGTFVYTLLDVPTAAGPPGLGVVEAGAGSPEPKPAYCTIAELNGVDAPAGCPG